MIAPSFGQFGGLEQYMIDVVAAAEGARDVQVSLCFKMTQGFVLGDALRAAMASTTAETAVVRRGSRSLLMHVLRADVVHCQTFSPDVILACRLLGKPLIVTVHGHRGPHTRSLTRLGDKLVGRAGERWYNSDFTWRSWEPGASRPHSRKISLSSPPTAKPVPAEQRRGFIFAARWVPKKGLEDLVDAYVAADLDHAAWPLVLLGDGPLRPAIEAAVKRSGLPISTPGFLAGNERSQHLASARWLVAPSNTHETLGLTPLEARALGVPCIVTRDGGLPESAGPFSIMCAPGNREELRLALEFAASLGESEYLRYSQASQRVLAAQETGIAEHLTLYRELGERLGLHDTIHRRA